MQKRERLEKTIQGEVADRAPAALWRSFPGDDQRSADFAQCIIDFQRRYDWDFVNIVPAHHYSVIDYGLQDEWQGAPDGRRVVLKSPIKRSLDWTELRSLDPERGELRKQLDAIRQVVEALSDTPIIVTVYSPLVQAARLAGEATFIRYLRKNGDRVRTGLNILTESTLSFIEALRVIGISGIAYVIEHADYDVFSESEYDLVGLPYDRKILETLPLSFWLNLVHLAGDAPMFRFAGSYKAQMLSWQAPDFAQSLSQVRSLFEGAICGGLHVEQHMRQGTPAIIRNQARDALQQMNNRRLVIGAGGPVLATTPLSNLRAVREAVEGTRV
jgi:uroporphyrinogen decarboxylase